METRHPRTLSSATSFRPFSSPPLNPASATDAAAGKSRVLPTTPLVHSSSFCESDRPQMATTAQGKPPETGWPRPLSSKGRPEDAALSAVDLSFWNSNDGTGFTERLRKEVEMLKHELFISKQKVEKLQQKEKILQGRLMDQASRQLKKGGTKFEDLSMGNFRPSQLVKRYSSLYAETRVEVAEMLDQLPEMANSEALKAKLLLSIIVLAFRSTQKSLLELRSRLKETLQIPLALDNSSNQVLPQPVKDLQNAVGHYLRTTIEKRDISKNYQEVCERLWTTLYDYPRLKYCQSLLSYIKECIQLTWALNIQNPPLVIDYEGVVFNGQKHTRFHTSNPEGTVIESVLWPALVEGEGGPCLAKGIVITQVHGTEKIV